jgi:uncharacterized membrane protein YgcG
MQREKHIISRLLVIPVAFSMASFLIADEAPPAQQQQAAVQASALTQDQLDTLVAPIALYPDPILSQILVAATYPLELVQANQWLQQHSNLKGQDLTTAAQQQTWDPSIQALVALPDVLKRLNQDITWTTSLGNAFLGNQAGVMDSVQRMRQKAQDAGKLKSTPQETVEDKTEDGQKTIEIQPANPDVVYVPVYDPAVIWGPPAYYYYPAWYYPPPLPGFWWGWDPGCYFSVSFFGWGGWGGWGWRPYWHSHTVIVNNVFITHNHFTAIHASFNAAGTAVWAHSPVHRMGVAYPNRSLSQQFHAPARTGMTAAAVQSKLHASAERFGSRQIPSAGFNRNRSAFGGMGRGSAVRAYSARGFSSLGHAGTAGSAAGHGGGHPAGGAGGGHSGAGGHPGGGGASMGGGGGHR